MGRMGMVLPPQYACVGRDWSMYFAPMIRVLDPSPYTFEVTVTPALDSITQDANGYYCTSMTGDIGSHSVLVVCKLSGTEVDRATTTLTVVADSLPATKVLTVGDSITKQGYYQEDLESFNSNITCIGTVPGFYTGVATEGYSGRTSYYLAIHKDSPFTGGPHTLDIPAYLALLGDTPDVITWVLGTNDAWQLRDSKAVSINRIISLEALIAAFEVELPGIPQLICGCPPGQPSADSTPQFYVDAFSLWMERLDRSFSDTASRTLCGPYTALLREGTTHYDGTDGLHPTPLGQLFLAESLYAAIVAVRN